MKKWLILASALWVCAIPLQAQQQAPTEMRMDSPALTEIRAALRERSSQLKPLMEAGTLGVSRDNCRLEVRDPAAVPLNQRQSVASLIAADARDKIALFREIARLNGSGDATWETQFAAKFSERCLNRVPAGWWIRNEAGQWTQKAQPNSGNLRREAVGKPSSPVKGRGLGEFPKPTPGPTLVREGSSNLPKGDWKRSFLALKMNNTHRHAPSSPRSGF
jgi:hypothetical protein